MVRQWFSFTSWDVMASWRNQSWASHLLYFVLMVSLFPLALGPEVIQQPGLAGGIIWLAAIFTSTLAAEHGLRRDLANGVFDQYMLSAQPLSALVTAKLCAIWVMSSVPFMLVTPILWLIYQQSWQSLGVMLATLLLGTPIITIFTSVATIMTYKAKRGATLLILLVLPLVIPILIVSTLAVQAAEQQLSFSAHLILLLGALFILAPLAPLAVVFCLRMVIYE